MKERGIIFNTEMVRAILDGRKTQTRRIVKNVIPGNCLWLKKPTKTRSGTTTHVLDAPKYSLCPLGKVGDRLWVRETWQGPLLDYEGANRFYEAPEQFQIAKNCVYKADATVVPEYYDADDNLRQGWKSSTQMPRWASRIILEITDIRVERLQAASDEDFKAEGYPLDRELTGGSTDAFCWFRHLWDSVSKPDCNFESNPWVWVIEFKRV